MASLLEHVIEIRFIEGIPKKRGIIKQASQ
jgi:hypothetical protein